MLTATITNNLTVAIGAGTVNPLPPPFDWMVIPASSPASAVVKTHDLLRVINQTSGFTSGDMLQAMIQKGTIAVAYVDLGATDVDTEGKAVATEAP